MSVIPRPSKRSQASVATAFATLALLVPGAPLAFAAPSSLRLSFSGAVSGTLVSGVVVCNSHVAAAKHKFFFDISGRAAAKTVMLSGEVVGYSSPHVYSVAAAYGHILLNFGGALYTGHTTGTIRVDHAAESGDISISLKNVSPGMPAGTAVIVGHFTCTSYTSA